MNPHMNSQQAMQAALQQQAMQAALQQQAQQAWGTQWTTTKPTPQMAKPDIVERMCGWVAAVTGAVAWLLVILLIYVHDDIRDFLTWVFVTATVAAAFDVRDRRYRKRQRDYVADVMASQ